jgi:tellurite resistance protein TerC
MARALGVANAALLELIQVTFLAFGATLIATAIQLFRHRDQDPQIEDNLIVRLAHRTLPTYDRYDEGRNHHAPGCSSHS